MRISNFVARCVAVLLFALLPSANAFAQPNCTNQPVQVLIAEAAKTQQVQAVADWVPLGMPARVAIAPPAAGGSVSYRVFVEPVGKEAVEVTDSVTAGPIKETHPWVKAERANSNFILLNFLVPSSKLGNELWSDGAVKIVVCKDGIIESHAHVETRLTRPKLTGLISIAFAAALYFFVSWCVRYWEEAQELRPLKWYRYLDPVILSSGPNGEGSLSRLQIVFFSFLIFVIVLNIFLMGGQLSDISENVLWLLGLSGGTAVIAKMAEREKNRLSFPNWAWLIDRKWLPKQGVAASKIATWPDIVTSADGVDVYRVQMLIFSLVVGVSLMLKGVTDLGSFQIPDSMLQLLGLSQVVYLGGRLVASPTYSELDKQIDELRKRESTFVEAALQPGAAPAVDLAQAKSRAKSEYKSWAEQIDIVKTMFVSIFGDPQKEADLEPDYPV